MDERRRIRSHRARSSSQAFPELRQDHRLINNHMSGLQTQDEFEYPFSLYAAQNNLGVIRLREKRYLDAANCFCQAVKYVNEQPSVTNPNDGLQNRVRDSSSNIPFSPQAQSLSPVEASDEASSRRNPSTDAIDSFYLLLDQENDDKKCSCETCQEGCSLETPEQKEETFVFRNPIIVSKNGVRPTILVRPTATNVQAMDKGTRSKLSLISVYNMALTYHLAALDTENDKNNESPHKSTPSEETNSDASSGLRKTRVLDGSNNEYNRPKKKQKRHSHSSKGEPCGTRKVSVPTSIANTTTNDNRENPTARNQNRDTSVDTVLLGQALSYYQIAYRILVSEQRVLVSQAMVILNNIGHIHRLMGNEATARKCFQRLLTTMIYLQQSGEARQQISHWDSFLNNVIDLLVAPEDSHKRFAPAA